MAKDSKLVYGANGKTNVLTFEPEKTCTRLPTKRTRFTMSASTFLSTKGWF